MQRVRNMKMIPVPQFFERLADFVYWADGGGRASMEYPLGGRLLETGTVLH